MHNAWINYHYLDDADYERIVNERKAVRAVPSGNQ